MAEQTASEAATKVPANSADEVDLTSILDPGQRADLTLLIANITESMRKVVVDNFSSTAGLDKTLLREGMTDEEKMMAVDPAKVDVSAYDRERKMKAEIDKDLATLKMKNLKKNSLKAYDEWREQVIERVGQVVNSKSTAQEQVRKGANASLSKPQAPISTAKVMEAGSRVVNLKFKDLFPPTRTPLTKLPMDKRTLVLHSLLLLLLSLEHYNAYSRILLLNLTSSLKLPLKTFEQDEYATAKGLLEAAKELTADEEKMKKIKENEETRKWRVRYATAAGAAILGVTGGMAAPLVAAGVGSVMGGLGLGATSAAAYLGTVAGSSVLVGGLFGAYGGRMTGQMMDSYARQVEDFQFLPVHGSSDKKTSEDEAQGAQEASEHDHKLRVTLGISGWLTEKEEVVKPWRSLGTGAEVFALKYELEALLNLGNAMNGMVQSAAWGYAQKEIISRTIFAELAAAMWPMALMKVARVIDNPFSVAKSRADKAGEVLADALVNRAQGERPVTLIGYSLGARVIYTCLMSLAKRKEFGIIENAVMIGSPTPSDTSDWRVLRSVVAGRLVNVFSVNDYVLGFMYRTSAIQYGVAGLQKVEGLSSVENFDVSEDVSSHQRYRYLIGAILKKIGFEDIDMAAVERERQELVEMEKEEERQSRAAQRRWLMRRESHGGKVDEAAEGEEEAEELEKKVQEQTKKSLVTRAIEYFYVPSVPSAKDAQKVASNLKKAGQDPSQAGNVADQTVKDAQASTESYATYIYKHLPSMPHINRSSPSAVQRPGDATNASKLTGQATEKAEGATSQGQSYVQQASQYLPSLPSMPSLSSGGKGQSKAAPKSATEKATDTGNKAAETTSAAAKRTAGTVSDVVTPTVKNALNPKDNPAAKSTKREPPIIHQAKDRTPAPVKDKTGEVAEATGTTVQNTTQTVQKGLDTSTGKAGDAAKATQDAGKSATDAAQGAAKTGQSYTSRAAAYLPSMPSMGFGGGGKKAAPPKLAKKPSESKQSVTTKPPKLDKTPSGVKSPPPRLDRLPSGAIKSPPPKLDRIPSGVKSPPPKLDRLPSGVKSPPPKLDRTPSGVKSPPPKLGPPQFQSGVPTPSTSVPTPSLIRQVSSGGGGVRSPPPKLGPRRSSSQQVQTPAVQTPAVPTPAAIGERLASLPQDATSAAKRAGNAATGAATGYGGENATKDTDKERDKGVEDTSSAAAMPSLPGASTAKGMTSSATEAASKASEAGKSATGSALRTGGGMVSGLGRTVGFGR
ncbi:uncharacterized protein Z520_07241 [Fonsecaea multimorphosa CBS 102226]|uniref:DUF726-domain-containing protein n=1 Tax=Fonsecaea multimorphosa CBS 102226 TaxID=1442371 RepID=A0A0D2JUH4_9EURO|nr:uncharacterized protein Z520_07241 [Fonsecaea multimorphosa CBS 102226]KIX97127.1 hypothetical protein Z520_07241 [Fonsecaea multimorphosa CBS 102226]OAL22902.1 hypothetical protein AYO22_06810 [Fonsecaea multimorphosa]